MCICCADDHEQRCNNGKRITLCTAGSMQYNILCIVSFFTLSNEQPGEESKQRYQYQLKNVVVFLQKSSYRLLQFYQLRTLGNIVSLVHCNKGSFNKVGLCNQECSDAHNNEQVLKQIEITFSSAFYKIKCNNARLFNNIPCKRKNAFIGMGKYMHQFVKYMCYGVPVCFFLAAVITEMSVVLGVAVKTEMLHCVDCAAILYFSIDRNNKATTLLQWLVWFLCTFYFNTRLVDKLFYDLCHCFFIS